MAWDRLIYIMIQTVVFFPISIAVYFGRWALDTFHAFCGKGKKIHDLVLKNPAEALEAHKKRVDRISAAIAAAPGMVGTGRPNHERVSSRLAENRQKKTVIDMADMDNVVKVDFDGSQKHVVVEPRVSMASLSHFLTEKGFMIACVPELEKNLKNISGI